MKKILILANNDVGLYNFRKELIEELIKRNYQVYISLPYGKKVDLLIDMGCKFIDTKIDRRGTNPIKDLKLLRKYYKIIKKINPDVILTYTIKPNIYGGIVCRILKKKCIANVTGLGSSSESKKIINGLIKKMYRYAFKYNYCIFCQNEENLEYLKRLGININALRLIPGSGVNLNKYKILEYPDDKIIRFLFISRIMKSKGIDEYLSAAFEIRSKYKNTEFNILGFCEEDYQEKLSEFEKKGIIKYYGMQDDIIPFLRKCHCTIHPTYYPEGMSNVLLESAASGRPIITTNRSGCKEIVDNNINGFLIKEKDDKDLIRSVEKFIKLPNNEKKQMGIAGRKKIEKEFDRNIVINEYMKVISEKK